MLQDSDSEPEMVSRQKPRRRLRKIPSDSENEEESPSAKTGLLAVNRSLAGNGLLVEDAVMAEDAVASSQLAGLIKGAFKKIIGCEGPTPIVIDFEDCHF